jgi:hypothetical protein
MHQFVASIRAINAPKCPERFGTNTEHDRWRYAIRDNESAFFRLVALNFGCCLSLVEYQLIR